VIVVLACAFLFILVMLILWKVTKFGRLLKPKLKKKDVQLHDLIVPVNHDAKSEAGVDVDLNPVLAAKMVIESDTGRTRSKGTGTLGENAKGALKRLLKGVGGTLEQGGAGNVKMKRADKLKALDLSLAAEAKADAVVEKKRKEDEVKYKQAEKAALDAKRGIV